MRDYITLSPGKLDDELARIAMTHRDQLIARNQNIVAQNLATANTWFTEHADLASWTPPRAGLLALMNYHFDIPSIELANKLAEDYSVMLAPGSAFGYEGYLRIGIGQAPEVFAEGLARTAICFEALQRTGFVANS